MSLEEGDYVPESMVCPICVECALLAVSERPWPASQSSLDLNSFQRLAVTAEIAYSSPSSPTAAVNAINLSSANLQTSPQYIHQQQQLLLSPSQSALSASPHQNNSPEESYKIIEKTLKEKNALIQKLTSEVFTLGSQLHDFKDPITVRFLIIFSLFLRMRPLRHHCVFLLGLLVQSCCPLLHRQFFVKLTHPQSSFRHDCGALTSPS